MLQFCSMSIMSHGVCVGLNIITQFESQGVDADEIGESEELCSCLASLKYLKGTFKKHQADEDYLYDALALTQRTGEKQLASPLELVSVFSEAIRLKKAALGARSTRDLLGLAVADFNKRVGKASSPALVFVTSFLSSAAPGPTDAVQAS